MQLRAIMLVDMEVDNFKEAASMEAKLQDSLNTLVSLNKNISYTALDIKERRGSAKPDISRMKFRQN
tara:strand:+ start:5435 stop:5635 length:201 start_codon:yes stop_codon:yes gene_type:complete